MYTDFKSLLKNNFFAKHICEGVSFQWSSKKEKNTKQNSSTDIIPSFTHKVVETDKPQLNNFSGADF